MTEDSSKETILFVDDEEDILDIASQFFELKGYRVFTAGNGVEAMKVIEKEPIDCCFTDINMPEMSGLELAEHIRINDNTIPVVIMTGYPSLENTIQTLKNGVVDFLIKPVNLEQMEVCVRRVLRERSLFIENLLLAKEVEGKARLEKLNNELMFKVEELYTLNRIMSEFTTISNSSDVFNRVIETAIEMTQASEAKFYVVMEGNGTPREVIAKSTFFEAADPDPVEQKAVARMIRDTVADEKPLLITENSNMPALPAKILSYILVPLTIRKKIFGVLTAAIKSGDRRFTEKDLYYLSFMANKAAYVIENLALYENIYENLFSTLYAFVSAIEARDTYTRQHSTRVTAIAVLIGRQMGCTEEELDMLNIAGLIHDIGKIGIRDDILLKPGKLTDDEFTKIKEHPAIGASIIERLGLWDREKQIIRCHHERFDGNGYPDGLKGGDIPFLARILTVADVYDAIASDRAYRKKMEESQILGIINGGIGTQFDPNVVKTFMALYENGDVQKTMEQADKAEG